MVTKKPVYLTTDDWALVLTLLRKTCTPEKAGSYMAQKIEASLFIYSLKRGEIER